ncbi:T9SS type B sorting domain-containing protein, partial [Tenacibaculum sp. L6]|uniref:T9SS type B sorting domain-containing protein n=1 Tax=Tenacibaculum sp. L6 TaxID=2992764 RepID=UPI00237AB673
QVNFSVSKADNACSTDGGEITVTIADGSSPYTATLTGALGSSFTLTGVSPLVFSGLVADDYTVSVVDSNNCPAAGTQNITINPDLDFDITPVSILSCVSEPEYSIEVSSGTGSYSYVVEDPSSTSVATGTIVAGTGVSDNFTLPVTTPIGTYTVRVTDTGSGNCVVNKTFEITTPVDPAFTVNPIDATCNGSATGRIELTVTAGLTPLTYGLVQTAGSGLGAGQGVYDAGSGAFINVPAGTYTVTATGANGCSTDVTGVVIGDNPPLTVVAPTAVQFGCATGNTVNNATLSIDTASGSGISGGSTVYSTVELYLDVAPFGDFDSSLDTEITAVSVSGTVNTYTINDRSGGNFYVRVVDSEGCESFSPVETINAFDELQDITPTPNDAISCVNGGELIDIVFNSSSAVTGATVTISDNTGATVETINNVDSGVSVTNTTRLSAGVYTVTVTHPVTGCELSASYEVQPEPTFDVLVSNIQRACFGGTGSATIDFSTATPYIGGYTYEVFEVGNPTAITLGNGTGGTPETITTNLVAGEYYVVVSMTNTPFCEAQSENFIIEEPATALALTGTPTYFKCGFPGSGEILLEAQGGWAPYEYQLVNDLTPATPVQNFDSNRRITGLIAGNYTATVRDVTGCEETFTFTLQPTTPMAADVTVTPNLCEGERTATIQVTRVRGGQTQDATVSYSYILTYPDGVTQVEQLSNTFSNLPAGTNYTVTVRDNKYSCTYTEQVDIIDPSEVEASANITADITCNNAATVVVSAIGGTGVYEYSSDGVNFVPNNTFINVSSGSQTFYVRDDNNCEDTVVVTVNAYEPLVPTLVVDSGFVTCNGDANGVLSATVAGGFGNYEYQLLDGSNNPIDGTWTTSNTFGGLNVGTYKIRVRSTNRFGEVCTEDTAPHPIVEPQPLVVAENHTDVSCFGGNDGTITVLASGGNLTGYEYNISTDPTNKFVTDNVFRNLAAGTYTITVKDKVGCIDTINVVIDQPQQFTATLVGVTEQTCINDATPTIELDAQGGTQPYYVSINNIEQPTPYTTNTIVLGAAENIQAGTSYYITVRDEAGCNVADPIRVTTAESVDLQLTVDFAYTCEVGNIIKAIVDEAYRANMSYTLYDGIGNPVVTNNTGEFIDVPAGTGYYVTATHTITSCSESSTSSPITIEDIQALTLDIDDSDKNTLIANADFGLPPYEYSVDGGDFGSDNEFLILQTKDYTITVRDARGCEVTLTVRGEYITIFVPNLFTPDGDGTNDYWYPREVEDYHDIKVFIYDRYARNIADFKGTVEGWDGTYDGKPLPSGDYWYTIYYKELSGQEKKIMGHFTLYRK